MAAGHDLSENTHAVTGFVTDFLRGDPSFQLDGQALVDTLHFTVTGGPVSGEKLKLKFAFIVFWDPLFKVFQGEGGWCVQAIEGGC